MLLDDPNNQGTGNENVTLDNNPVLNQPEPKAWDSAPQSWRTDTHESYKALPENVRQYIHERENQVVTGLKSYSSRANGFDRLVKHFEPFRTEHPDLDPTGLLESLAQNHVRLVQADPAGRKEMLKSLAKHYGVSFEDVKEMHDDNKDKGGGNDQGFTPAQIKYLQETFGPAFGQLKELTEANQASKLEAAGKTIDAFFSDPKNKYAEKVAAGIVEQIKGLPQTARNLERAYELACLADPTIRPLYLKDMMDAAAGGGQQPDPKNLKQGGAPVKEKAQTADEAANAVLKKHYPNFTGKVKMT